MIHTSLNNGSLTGIQITLENAHCAVALPRYPQCKQQCARRSRFVASLVPSGAENDRRYITALHVKHGGMLCPCQRHQDAEVATPQSDSHRSCTACIMPYESTMSTLLTHRLSRVYSKLH